MRALPLASWLQKQVQLGWTSTVGAPFMVGLIYQPMSASLNPSPPCGAQLDLPCQNLKDFASVCTAVLLYTHFYLIVHRCWLMASCALTDGNMHHMGDHYLCVLSILCPDGACT